LSRLSWATFYAAQDDVEPIRQPKWRKDNKPVNMVLAVYDGSENGMGKLVYQRRSTAKMYAITEAKKGELNWNYPLADC